MPGMIDVVNPLMLPLALWMETGVFILVSLLAFGLLVSVASRTRFELMLRQVRQQGPDREQPDQALRIEMIERLGRLKKEVDPFTVILLRPPQPAAHVQVNDEDQLHALTHALRTQLRATDFVCRLTDQRIAILGTFNKEQAPSVLRRLHAFFQEHEYTATESPAKAQTALRIASVSTPEDGVDSTTLMKALRHQFEQADTSHRIPETPGTPQPSASETVPQTSDTAPVTDPRGILDQETGVLKLERMRIVLPRMVARQRQRNLSASVCLFAIDHFAQYQDLYGDPVAVHLLKQVADLLADQTREFDLLARVGPGELALGLEADSPSARTVALRMLDVFSNHTFSIPQQQVTPDIDVGIATCPTHTTQPGELIELARAAMQAARRNDTESVVEFTPDLRPATLPSEEESNAY